MAIVLTEQATDRQAGFTVADLERFLTQLRNAGASGDETVRVRTRASFNPNGGVVTTVTVHIHPNLRPVD